MALPNWDWLGRHRRLVLTLCVLLLVVVIAESAALLQHWRTGIVSRRQSDRSLTTFLLGDTAQAGDGSSVHIRLQNVRFKWSDQVYIDANDLALRAVPARGQTVDFDDPGSFRLVMQQAVVRVKPDVLGGMCNESIFNYPDSHLHKLEVAIVRGEDGVRTIQLKGKVNVVTWIPFTMLARLSVDTKTNTLVITAEHVKVFGLLSVTRLMGWSPLHLDRLISLPPNKSLLIDGNRIMVKPFGLFPPPRIDGTIASVEIEDDAISIAFAGDAITAPVSTAKNYVYLRGGASQFGHFRMADTDVLILDQDQSNPFVFSLLHYAMMIPRSTFQIPDTRSAQITMPDF